MRARERQNAAEIARRAFCIAALSICLFTFLDTTVFAGPFPVGPEFQVNTNTVGWQNGPDVASDGSGGFFVVWVSETSSGSDSSSFSIQGRRFDSAGMPAGTEFQVNTSTTNAQYSARVAATGSGNFVVVWRSPSSGGSDSSGYSVQGQRFDGAGMPVGTEFQVNSHTTDNQRAPSVASDGSGSFVVVWTSESSSGSDSAGDSVQGQRFDSAGIPAGTEFQVNTYTTDDQYAASVASDASGNFVVVWQSRGSSGSDSSFHSIQGQRFDSSAMPLGTEFQINTYTTNVQSAPSVASDGPGNFVVVWQGFGASVSESSSSAIEGQRFDSTGMPQGTEFQVNTYTTSSQFSPRVALDTPGSFVVVWGSNGSSGSDSSYFSIQGQRFDSVGVAVGAQFQVNTFTTNRQAYPSIAADASGNFVVVWRSRGLNGSDASDDFIRAQRFSTTMLCGPVPEGVCRVADVSGAGRSSVQIKNLTDGARDQLAWTWNKGAATAVTDFKFPDTATATYRLCIYDASGAAQPMFEADIRNGGDMQECGHGPCWKAVSTGFQYSNPSATPGGIKSVSFEAGSAGAARVKVRAAGALLAPPELAGLMTDVVVQLLIDDGATIECFQTVFPGPSGRGAVRTHTPTRFKARGP